MKTIFASFYYDKSVDSTMRFCWFVLLLSCCCCNGLVTTGTQIRLRTTGDVVNHRFRYEQQQQQTSSLTLHSAATILHPPTRPSLLAPMVLASPPKRQSSGWARRTLSRILRLDKRKQQNDEQSAREFASSFSSLTNTGRISTLMNHHQSNFVTTSSAILSDTKTPLHSAAASSSLDIIASQHDNWIVDTTTTATSDFLLGDTKDNTQQQEEEISKIVRNNGDPPLYAWLSRQFVQVLFDLMNNAWICKQTRRPHENLQIAITSHHDFRQLLLRGQYRGDATMTWSKLYGPNLQCSQGKLHAKHLAVSLWSFVSKQQQQQREEQTRRRFPRQFEFFFEECTFTSNDLIRSTCIRDGLQDLLKRVLRQGFKWSPEKITIESIQIKNSKVSIQGNAAIDFRGSIASNYNNMNAFAAAFSDGNFGPLLSGGAGQSSTSTLVVPFQVRSKIGTKSRGHVLTFPELEVELSLMQQKIACPILPEVTLDVGYNTQFTQIDLDQDNQIQFSAKSRITPQHTLTLRNYMQSTHAYSSPCAFDIGKWLTELGRFSI